jgi:hypothetical protein
MTFRFNRTFNGHDDSGRPVLWGRIDDPVERSRLLGYLRGAPIALTSASYGKDMLTGERMAIRAEYRTDGEWIWSEAAVYYLDRHGVAPSPELRAAIAERGYVVPPVNPATVALAREAALARERAAIAEAPTPHSRFPADVDRILRAGGWSPGRDVSATVDAWLAWLIEDQELLADRPEAMHAARPVLHEFGGVYCQIYGPGRDKALSPFGFYPQEDPPDPFSFQDLGEKVGAKLFPIGYAEEYRQHIVMAADGRVFMDNSPNECFVAATPDEAIVVLAQGRALTFL